MFIPMVNVIPSFIFTCCDSKSVIAENKIKDMTYFVYYTQWCLNLYHLNLYFQTTYKVPRGDFFSFLIGTCKS